MYHNLFGTDSDDAAEDLEEVEDYSGGREDDYTEFAGALPQFLGLQVIQRALFPRRRLAFDPLGTGNTGSQPPPSGLANMAAAARADMRVKFRTYSGKSKEDPDCHVSQFEIRWQARGFAGVYDAQAKMRQFEATLEGKAMQWFSNFPAGHFADYDALKIAFLHRFRREKTPQDVLTNLRKVRQKKMFVEDYSQKFNQYVRRLTPAEKPTDEMLAGYFLNGLRKELRTAVAGVDVAGGLDVLVETATRAEKRFGVSHEKSKVKKKGKSKKKKRKSDDSDSDTDSESDSDTDSDSDSDSDSSDDSSDSSDSDEDTEKKKRTKKKSGKKSKPKNQEELVEKMVNKKLKKLGVQQNSLGKTLHCDICDKDNHDTKDCYYNPAYRGVIPK